MGLSGFAKNTLFTATASVFLLLSACGDGHPPAKSLYQQSRDLDQKGDGFKLCRMEYTYPIAEGREEVRGYIALSGENVPEIKKQILAICDSYPLEQAHACATSQNIDNVECVRQEVLADSASKDKQQENKVYECSFRSKWRRSGFEFEDLDTFVRVSADKKVDAVKGLIDECLAMASDHEREGCSKALIEGKLRCVMKDQVAAH